MSREIHLHVEEPSMEAYLEELLPRITSSDISIRLINHTNKQKLLREVPLRLKGYARMPNEYRPLTLVLVDRDSDDCHALKATLEAAAANAGLISKTEANDVTCDVVNRIVVEELEAWHFGDVAALRQEYPGVPASLGVKAQFRFPDAIAGGTHEALLRVLQRAGYYQGMSSLPKVDAARRLARRVNLSENRSESFQQFLVGLNALTGQLTGADPNA